MTLGYCWDLGTRHSPHYLPITSHTSKSAEHVWGLEASSAHVRCLEASSAHVRGLEASSAHMWGLEASSAHMWGLVKLRKASHRIVC